MPGFAIKLRLLELSAGSSACPPRAGANVIVLNRGWLPGSDSPEWRLTAIDRFEYGGVYNVERRIIEQHLPIRRRFLADQYVRR